MVRKRFQSGNDERDCGSQENCACLKRLHMNLKKYENRRILSLMCVFCMNL